MNGMMKRANEKIKSLEEVRVKTVLPSAKEFIKVGVDLGTAYIVVVALNQENQPLALEMEYAEVIRDGLIVDFIGAKRIVEKLKLRVEERLGIPLMKASIAVPPGTGDRDQRTHCYVVEGAGMEVADILDEPTAANGVLGIRDGAIVDIGGGTTGISILQNGEVVYVADEATGGTHLSLVLAGHHKIPFNEAEQLKKDWRREQEVLQIVRPVIEKMASIVKKHIVGFDVQEVYLVGGTCCLRGLEKIFEEALGIRVSKPDNPFLVTPLGIALGKQ